jgi:CubicO group peptidase (beta-lactamase class C family)
VLLQLHDKGTLSLEDRLSKWFPDYPKSDQITLKMLINGTSGYADYVADDAIVPLLYADPFRAWQADELIALALKKPMPCDPGMCWSYAHTNFVILGKVLEKASGRRLQDLIREGILEPLSLKDTRSEMTAIIQEPVLHAFDGERGRYEDSTYWDPSWTLAEGAIMSSNIADILKSAAAIGEGTLVSPQSHAAQIAPETAKFKPWNATAYYGLGVFVANGWDHSEPVFRRLCRDHGVPSRTKARDRRIRDLEGKGIDERQSLDRPRQGDRRVSRARGSLQPIADPLSADRQRAVITENIVFGVA